MWIPAVLLWILNTSCLCSGQDYMDYYQSGDMGTQAPQMSDDRPGLESVKSVDQLLQVLFPEYNLLQHCLRRRSGHYNGDHDDVWGGSRREALFKADGMLAVILEEIKKTECQPREVCVEVNKEYPESTSQFFYPRCMALHRCGGCCTNEAFYCTNTSHALVNKTLMELTPPRMDHSFVMVTFVNHTACECRPKRPLHSIIRRAVADHLCSPPQDSCAPGFLWDPVNCVCVPMDTLNMNYAYRETEALHSGLLALCGPNQVLDKSTCDCVCQNGRTEASCDPGWKLDPNTCECRCEGRGDGRVCPTGQRWDDDLCGCVCAAECPGNQPLNPDTCLCQCRESEHSCLRQGKKFKASTCSCYRLPCRKPRPVCQSGFYYSHLVCQCIPNYMRPQWN